MCKFLADINGFNLTDQYFRIRRNINASQLCNGMCGLSYNLCI